MVHVLDLPIRIALVLELLRHIELHLEVPHTVDLEFIELIVVDVFLDADELVVEEVLLVGEGTFFVVSELL